MTNLFDDPELVEKVESIVNDDIEKIEIAVNLGRDLGEAIHRQLHGLMWLISTRARRGIHFASSHESTARNLNEQYAVLGLFGLTVADHFEGNGMYWKGVVEGSEMMFIAMVERELEALGVSRGVWWTGKRFISDKDLRPSAK